MNRREFIALAGGATMASPLRARAQLPMPVIGFLRSTSHQDSGALVTAFRQGLKDLGYVEGQNVAIEFRWADGRRDRVPTLVADLIARPVAVIAGDAIAMLAAKAATTAIPVVFAAGGDPVGDGLVANVNRPGGNVTGVHFFAGVLGAKRLELLRELVPNAKTIAMLVYPNTRNTEAERKDVQAAALKVGQPLMVEDVTSERDIDAAFVAFDERGAGALIAGSSPFMTFHNKQVIALAARHRLPTIYTLREFAEAGGLMSYGAGIADAYRQLGVYAARILKGETPGGLPVMRSTKFEFVINLKTARNLGLNVPPTVLARADEVIE